MLDILSYSLIGALAAFSPNLTVFLVLRALFGVAMGGEWGLGSSLAMESIPPQARGTVSGILQCGYPSGFLLAAVAYGLLYGKTFGDYTFGWRAMFLLSILPALVVLFIRARRGARDHPGVRLPGRQFPRLLQWAVSGRDRRGQMAETMRSRWRWSQASWRSPSSSWSSASARSAAASF